MSSLSGPELKRALDVVSSVAALRLKDSYCEDEIARTVGFGSAEAMRLQLANWSLPEWLVGETSDSERPTSKRRRKARRGEGPRQELPPPAEAIPLFKQAFGVLNEEIDALENRKMYLQDERFVAVDEYHDPVIWSRQGITDEDWKNLCQKFGKDSDSDRFELWDARFVEPAGATQSPQEPVTKLIAIYVLAGLPLEPLLEKLHFAPETIDEAELRRHIEGEKVKKRRNGKTSTQHISGLKTKASHVARLIYGGTLRPGPSTGELSPSEQNIVWYRQQRIREGIPDNQIYQELKAKRGLTKHDYARLKRFHLDAPPE
jgi:hypothetical protein